MFNHGVYHIHALLFPNKHVRNSDLRDFYTTKIKLDQPYGMVQDELQRHKCKPICKENQQRQCKEFPAYYIKKDVELFKSQKTLFSEEILKGYRKYLSELAESGHNYRALEELSEVMLLEKLNCSYSEYIYAVSTTVTGNKAKFFKRDITDVYNVPHNVEATQYFNATTHALLCDSLAVAIYVSKYATKWDEGGRPTEFNQFSKPKRKTKSYLSSTYLKGNSIFKAAMGNLASNFGSMRTVSKTECLYQIRGNALFWTSEQLFLKY